MLHMNFVSFTWFLFLLLLVNQKVVWYGLIGGKTVSVDGGPILAMGNIGWYILCNSFSTEKQDDFPEKTFSFVLVQILLGEEKLQKQCGGEGILCGKT